MLKRPEMTTEVMEISREQALDFLKKNTINRPIRKSWVRSLKDMMNRGEWKIMHQGVAVDYNNVLIDGQHRLTAFLQSDLDNLPINVSFDCDPTSFEVVDSGLGRTHADSLRVSPTVTAIARFIHRLPDPHIGNYKLSRPQLRAILDWAGPAITRSYELGGSKRTARTSAPILSAISVHMLAGHEVEEQYAAFAKLDFDLMAPSVKSLTKQMIEGGVSSRGNEWDMGARAWRAFDPTGLSVARVQIKDPMVAVSEMAKAVDTARRRLTKQGGKAR